MGAGGGGGCPPTLYPNPTPNDNAGQLAEEARVRMRRELGAEQLGTVTQWEGGVFVRDAAQPARLQQQMYALASRSGNDAALVSGIVNIATDVLGQTINTVSTSETEQRAAFLYIKDNQIISVVTKVWKNVPPSPNQSVAVAYVLAIIPVQSTPVQLEKLAALLRDAQRGVTGNRTDHHYFGDVWRMISSNQTPVPGLAPQPNPGYVPGVIPPQPRWEDD
ncbi:unnamed protein product [Rhizoctonia solani]|uniref:Uncharacterized protein n=1 Tax=Rhizoctonia solani TaxID=456999 RepID=A0A8H3DK77_9AGAM|nr:unnamed protein product [Rhizoctonia solani]